MSCSSLLIRFSMLMFCGTEQCDARLVQEAKKLWKGMTDLVTCLILRVLLL